MDQNRIWVSSIGKSLFRLRKREASPVLWERDGCLLKKGLPQEGVVLAKGEVALRVEAMRALGADREAFLITGRALSELSLGTTEVVDDKADWS